MSMQEDSTKWCAESKIICEEEEFSLNFTLLLLYLKEISFLFLRK